MTEPLLLLPGMMCDGRLFEHQIAAFSAKRAVMIAPLTGHADFTEMAEAILANAPLKFALGGLSMGGIAAMEIIRLAPKRVTRLALMDTNHLADTQERLDMRDAQIEQAARGGLYAIMREEMKPNYLSDGPNKNAILDLCMEMAQTLGPEVFISQSLALKVRRDQTENLKTIQVPTLVLCGEDDTLCPVSRHETIRDLIPGAVLSVVKDAGHLPVLEQADMTNDILGQWLSGPKG